MLHILARGFSVEENHPTRITLYAWRIAFIPCVQKRLAISVISIIIGSFNLSFELLECITEWFIHLRRIKIGEFIRLLRFKWLRSNYLSNFLPWISVNCRFQILMTRKTGVCASMPVARVWCESSALRFFTVRDA